MTNLSISLPTLSLFSIFHFSFVNDGAWYALSMALQTLRRNENVAGEFYVDNTCIDCDLCRQIAPESFSRAGEMSAVHRQPESREAQLAALKALITTSIFVDSQPSLRTEPRAT